MNTTITTNERDNHHGAPNHAGHPGPQRRPVTAEQQRREAAWRANATLCERGEIIDLQSLIPVVKDSPERRALLAERDSLIDACVAAGGPIGCAASLIARFALAEHTGIYRGQTHATLYHREHAAPAASLSGEGIHAVEMSLPASSERITTWWNRPYLAVWRVPGELAHVVYFDGDISVLIAHDEAAFAALNAQAAAYYPTLWQRYAEIVDPRLPGLIRERTTSNPVTIKAPATLPPRTRAVTRALLSAERAHSASASVERVGRFDTGARSLRATVAALREARRRGLAVCVEGRWSTTELAHCAA